MKMFIQLKAESIIYSDPEHKPDTLLNSTQSGKKPTQFPTISYPDVSSPGIIYMIKSEIHLFL